MKPQETLSPPQVQWTDEQSAAIHHAGCDLLVSAAAGSGKTAVLAERCAWLVCDASHPCDVDQLLVVTFTKAAAAQMKQRIGQALRQRLERLLVESKDSNDPKRTRLLHQLALLDRAAISTLHGFCDSLVRRHHAQLGLDPAYKILDADEAVLLRRTVARDLFEDWYDRHTAADTRDAESDPIPADRLSAAVDFQRFVDDYGDGNDEWLLQRVLAAHELLQSIVDPEQWRRKSRQQLHDAANQPLDKSELGIVLHQLLRYYLNALGKQCRRTQAILRQRSGFNAYERVLDKWAQAIAHWLTVLKEHGLSPLGEEVQNVQWPRLPAIPNDVPGKDAAKKLMDDLKNQLAKGPLPQLLRFTPEQWREGMKMTLPFADLFLDLVEEFGRRYAQAKSRRRALDFSDLERHALAALRLQSSDDPQQPSPAALDCRRRYRHVLVDEYQDINEVQDAILSTVGGWRPAADREEPPTDNRPLPTMFYVGDVKQSIYRFRLADPRRFLDRMEQFRGDGAGRVIDLQHNFRSRGPLLEAINAVFTKLMTNRGGAGEIEYDATHRLRAGREFPSHATQGFSGAPIELHILPAPSSTIRPGDGDEDADDDSEEGQIESGDADRAEREALLIARRIGAMVNPSAPMQVVEGDGTSRPITYRDIVILLRSVRHKAGVYARVLRQAGIPVHSDGGADFFSATEVRDMLALLRVLDNPNQDIPLAAVLRGPLSGDRRTAQAPAPEATTEEDLAGIHIAFAHEAEPPAFHEAVRRYASEKQDELSERLRGVLARIERWRALAARRPVAEVIWTIFQESGFLTYVAGLNDGRQREANLLHLYQRARQFGGFQRQGLMRFLQFLDQLADGMDEPSVTSEAENVVRIMTIHTAKGLEFPVVFLADLGKAFNMSDLHQSVLMDRAGGIGLKVADERLRVRYPSLAWSLLRERLRRQTLAEELRLLYVAMTRARECLICIGSSRKTEKLAEGLPQVTDGRDGALPPEVILSAGNSLDWMLAAAGAMEDNGAFDMTIWDAKTVNAWPSPRELRPKLDAWQLDRAALKPLPAPPASSNLDSDGSRVIQRLTWVYPYDPFTRQAASLAVTQQTHGGSPENATSAAASRIEIPLPSLRPANDASTATRRGSAVHEALRFIDFSRPCDAADLRGQLESLCADGKLSQDQLEQVDIDDLCWLMETPPGQLLRTHAGQLRRELPFTWARAPDGLSSPDPLDRQIVRGRLDVLIPTDKGPVVVDYKTDHVWDETLEQRVAQYRMQLQLYGEALKQVTGRQPAGAWLVFLHARQVRDVL